MGGSTGISPTPNTSRGILPNRFYVAGPDPIVGGIYQQTTHYQLGWAFVFAAIAVLVRFAYLHEILVVLAGAKLYLLYVFGLPALVSVLLSGGIRRVLQSRPAVYWMLFTVWIAVAIPFSVWKGGSMNLLIGYLKVGPPVLFLIAGSLTNWRQSNVMMWMLVLAAGMGLLTARLFQVDIGGRFSLEFGSIQNANDFAAHLLLLLPFLLWVALSSRSPILRMLSLAGMGFGFYIILRTASRGAVVALAVDFAFFLWRATQPQRIVALLLIPVVIAILVLVVPHNALVRIQSFSSETSSGSSNVAKEAAGSASTREYVVGKGIEYTLHHPIFGVGPGEFTDFEGSHNQTVGTHGYYLAAHNSFLQVSSECGIPGLLLFTAAIVATFRMLNATNREARRKGFLDISNATFCVMLALIGFTIAAAFLSLAYSFYFPALAGLAGGMSVAAKQEFVSRPAAA